MLRKILFLLVLFPALSYAQYEDKQYVALGNAYSQGFIFEGGLNYERAKFFQSGSNREQIDNNQLGFRLKAEYGIFPTLKVHTEFNTKNLSVQNGKLGVKYEIPLATFSKDKQKNSFVMVIAPQVDFNFPLWRYETESTRAIGNRPLGFTFGSTFWFQIYKINMDIRLWAAYNLIFSPIPNNFNLKGQIGKQIKSFYVAAHYDWQKSFGAGDYFGGFSTFRELPITWNKAGLDVVYTHKFIFDVGLQGNYMFKGFNTRRALFLELRFAYFFATGGR